MRKGFLCIAIAAGLLLAPVVSQADQVQDQLQQMQDRLAELEDKLDATSDQLEAANAQVDRQQEIIDRSGIADERAGSSGLAAFLDTLEVGGWISGTYFYNFDDPDGVALGGANVGTVPAYPFRPDANSFSVDQLWFELERPVDEMNRAGFRADIVYGKDAGLLSGDSGAGDGLSGNDLEMYQAYIQYLAPIGEGVTFQFGKFATVIGAEVVQSPYNFNITRGHVYNLFQPITHTGILASMDWEGGFSTSLGLVNETRSFPAADIDLNKDKAVLWSLGWAGGEGVSASFNGAYGASDSGQGTNTNAGDKELILDLILGWDPTPDFSAYINADYINSENSVSFGEFDGWGVAAAGRYALNERLGLALRAEYVALDFDDFGAIIGGDQKIWGVTTTMDYALTEQLKVRGEVRYDNVRSSDNAFQNAFFDDSDALTGIGTEDDQVTAGVEVLYTF